jgi:hypothetical protein
MRQHLKRFPVSVVRRSASAQFHDSTCRLVAQKLGVMGEAAPSGSPGIRCDQAGLRVDAAAGLSALSFRDEREFFRFRVRQPDHFSAPRVTRLAEFLLQRD